MAQTPTRAALLLAARRSFVVHGYKQTTRAIADDAGVNVSIINRDFGSKDGLYAVVLEESAEADAAELNEPRAAGDRTQLVDRVGLLRG